MPQLLKTPCLFLIAKLILLIMILASLIAVHKTNEIFLQKKHYLIKFTNETRQTLKINLLHIRKCYANKILINYF